VQRLLDAITGALVESLHHSPISLPTGIVFSESQQFGIRNVKLCDAAIQAHGKTRKDHYAGLVQTFHSGKVDVDFGGELAIH